MCVCVLTVWIEISLTSDPPSDYGSQDDSVSRRDEGSGAARGRLRGSRGRRVSVERGERHSEVGRRGENCA